MEGSQPITVWIITPEKTIYKEVVNHVILPGIEGEVGIFHNHTPFMTYITPGHLQIHLQNSRVIYMAIKSGLIEFKDDLLTVLTIEEIAQENISVKMAENEDPQD
ncbi:MAG: FoF1 ATP synthase subunit delta/epsilon [bacterium]